MDFMKTIINSIKFWVNRQLENYALKTDIVSPDLSVNDESDPRYVHGRTHWIGDPVETVLIPEQTVAFEDMDGMGQAVSPVTIELVEGQTYTVNFDGVTYECIPNFIQGGYLCIGSPAMLGLEDTGEPFVYLYVAGEGVWGAYNAATEHVLSMTTIATEIVKIPDKFLPEYDFAGKTVSSKRIMGHDGNEYVGGMYAEIFNDLTNKASNQYSHAEGSKTTAMSSYSHAEGYSTKASGRSSHAEGEETSATDKYAHAEGHYTKASGSQSHAEGGNTTASGIGSHAEGSVTKATGYAAHAEGTYTTASGYYSHAEGERVSASNEGSHAEGCWTTASGRYSHSEGYHTTASSYCQHVQGKYNIDDTEGKYAHIVGNGNSDASTGNVVYTYSNAHTLDWEGNAWFAGKVYVGGTGQDDENAIEVATLAKAEDWIFTLEDGSTVTKKVVLG